MNNCRRAVVERNEQLREKQMKNDSDCVDIGGQVLTFASCVDERKTLNPASIVCLQNVFSNGNQLYVLLYAV